MTTGPRILVAHNVHQHQPGGMSRIMGFIHRHVARAGYEVDFFAAEQVPTRSRGRRARFAFPLAVRNHVRRARRDGRPYAIVNVHEPVGGLVVRPAQRTGARVVVTSHGLEERAWALALEEGRLGRGGPRLASRLGWPLTVGWQATMALRRADHVFCLHEDDRRYLERRYGRAPESITRMLPGADLRFADAARARRYDSATSMLFAGTWRKNKGIQDLVPAVTQLVARHSALTLHVLGHGVPDQAVRRAFPPPVRDRIICLATTTEQQTAEVFAAADLFVLPSLFEGTPLTLMEAMMSGLPIATTRTCGMQDVIRDGENGLLVPIRDPTAIVTALDRLLGDPPLRARLGRTAREEAMRHYTWDRVAQPVLDVYDRLVSA